VSDCWIDLFEAPGFGGKLRRIFGPGLYTHLRGSTAGVQIESAIMGAGAFTYFYESASSEHGVWISPGASIARLSDARITSAMDSVRICDRAPQTHDRGYASYVQAQRLNR
jgi:hypothetical protein